MGQVQLGNTLRPASVLFIQCTGCLWTCSPTVELRTLVWLLHALHARLIWSFITHAWHAASWKWHWEGSWLPVARFCALVQFGSHRWLGQPMDSSPAVCTYLLEVPGISFCQFHDLDNVQGLSKVRPPSARRCCWTRHSLVKPGHPHH